MRHTFRVYVRAHFTLHSSLSVPLGVSQYLLHRYIVYKRMSDTENIYVYWVWYAYWSYGESAPLCGRLCVVHWTDGRIRFICWQSTMYEWDWIHAGETQMRPFSIDSDDNHNAIIVTFIIVTLNAMHWDCAVAIWWFKWTIYFSSEASLSIINHRLTDRTYSAFD